MKRRRNSESGFALLLVFLMASAVALMLYMQLRRAAFESERDKEQMLIDRGEQYKRAIYMYYASNNRQWPARVEDLENTNNHRYLRRRYINPYTGKDEWRLIHTNGAFLTDSLVTPPPAQGSPGVQGGALAGTGPPTGGSSGFSLTSPSSMTASTASSTSGGAVDPNAPPPVNAQVQRRPSDRALVQNSSYQTAPTGPLNPNDPGYQPFNPATLPPISLYPNGYNAPPVGAPGTNQPGVNQPGGNQPGVNQPGVNQPGVNQPGLNQPGLNQPGFNQPVTNQPGFNQPITSQPGFTAPGTNAPGTTPGVIPPTFNPQNFNQPGFNQPVVSQQPNQPNSGQTGGIFPSFPGTNPPGGNVPFSQPGNPGQPGGFPGSTGQLQAPTVPGAPGGPTNQAVNLINQLLTTPQQPPTGPGATQQQSGGGLAGVASTFKGPSIKTYADRSKYQEWEFVFQLNPQGTLQAPVAAGALGPNGGPAGPTPPGGQTPQGQSGAPGFPGTSGFPSTGGGNITTGGSSGNLFGGTNH
jgi:hypothetical protein